MIKVIVKNWPKNVTIMFGESEIRKLASQFKLWRQTADNKILRVCPLASFRKASCHWKRQSTQSLFCRANVKGFSQMNLIFSPLRSFLNVSTVSGLMFIEINGAPLRLFNLAKYVDSWLISGHHSALTVKSEDSLREKKFKESNMNFWKIFYNLF